MEHIEIDVDTRKALEECAELVAQVEEQLAVEVLSRSGWGLAHTVNGPTIQRVRLVAHIPCVWRLEESSGCR